MSMNMGPMGRYIASAIATLGLVCSDLPAAICHDAPGPDITLGFHARDKDHWKGAIQAACAGKTDLHNPLDDKTDLVSKASDLRVSSGDLKEQWEFTYDGAGATHIWLSEYYTARGPITLSFYDKDDNLLKAYNIAKHSVYGGGPKDVVTMAKGKKRGELIFSAYRDAPYRPTKKVVAESQTAPPGKGNNAGGYAILRSQTTLFAWLERKPAGNTPELANGRICLNAQAQYKKAKWQAFVLPSGTTATVIPRPDVGVNVKLSATPATLKTLKWGDIIWASEDGKAGTYWLSIMHNLNPEKCGVSLSEYVFTFVLETRTDQPPIETGSGDRKHRELDTSGDHPWINAFTKTDANPPSHAGRGQEIDAGMYWAAGQGSGAKGHLTINTFPLDRDTHPLYAGNVKWTVKVERLWGYWLEVTPGPIGGSISLSGKIGPIGLGLSSHGRFAVAAWNHSIAFPHIGQVTEAGTVTLDGSKFVPFPASPVVSKHYNGCSDIIAPNTTFEVGKDYALTGGTLVSVERSVEKPRVIALAKGSSADFTVHAVDSKDKVTHPRITK